MRGELITKLLFIGSRAKQYFINNKEKLSEKIKDISIINNDKYQLDIFEDFIFIEEIEVQNILVVDSDDYLVEEDIKAFKDLSVFTVIDIGLDKLNIIKKYFGNENIIKADKLDGSLDLLILGMLNICKPVKRFGDMNCNESSSKELLGYRKYRYKKIDKVASSIKELEEDIMEFIKMEESENIILILFFHYEKFFQLECEVLDLEYELGEDKKFICFKVAHDSIDNQDNIELLVMYN